jgi:murein L,D-transpeptidase YafK
MYPITRRGALSLGLAASIAACSKFQDYRGPEVTRVVVQKQQRRMMLIHHNRVLESYRVQLGFAAEGHKQFEGDGRTPEGRYHVDRRNPDSRFFLSLGIDYPNAADRAFAEAHGRPPGGDIFIHGWGDERRSRSDDWTAGCVAVTNREMQKVYAMVRTGTPVDLFA